MVRGKRGVNLLDLARELRDALRGAFEIFLPALLFDFQNHEPRFSGPKGAEGTQ